VNLGALRQQLWYGMRGHFGWLLQSLNHRFDVFILGYFSGTSAVGYYAVAFNLAEMTWWMPLALGTALFPRASSLDAKANAALTASVIRRALPLTFCSILAMMLLGQPIIILLYGSAFEQSVAPFLILAPSGIFFTVYRLLSISLAAQGRPQASLYGGLVSVPIMLGANIILTPSLGAVGAAIASNMAYGAYAAYLVWYFRRATAMSIRSVFLPTRTDLAESVHFALGLMSRLTSRLPRPATVSKR
jgi:O-antigen/teichoic acid export membrane protein